MSDCQTIKKLIQQSLDSTLKSEELDFLTLHIAECVVCAEYQERMIELENNLMSIATSGPHADLAEPNLIAGIMPDIERITEERRERAEQRASNDEGTELTGWRSRLVRSGWIRKYGLAVALVVMMVPIGIGISYSLDQEAGGIAQLSDYGAAPEERAGNYEQVDEIEVNDQTDTSSNYRVQVSTNELVVYSSDVEVFRTDSWIDGVRADYQLLEDDTMVYKLYSAEGENLANYHVNLLTKEVVQLNGTEIDTE